MLSTRTVRNFKEFIELEPLWNDLLSRSDSDVPFLTFEWIRCWWDSFAEGKELFIILVENELKQVIAIAPLMLLRDKCRNFPVKSLRFIKDYKSSHANFIITERYPEVYDSIFGYLKGLEKVWDVIVLDSLIENADSAQALKRSVQEASLKFFIIRQHSSPYISVNSDWESFFSQKSSKFRKTLRNEVNRIKRIGEIEIKEVTAEDNLNKVLDEIAEVSKKSWKGNMQSDLGRDQESLAFYRSLSEKSREKGWLSIWLLKVDKKTIAMEYHLRYKNKVYGLRGDFDSEYKHCSPGAVLDYHIVQDVFLKKISEYDMCGDAYQYKLEWTELFRNHQMLTIYNRSVYPFCLYILETKLAPFLRKIRKAFVPKYNIKRNPSN